MLIASIFIAELWEMFIYADKLLKVATFFYSGN
jgi:hypothetical protein